VWITASGAKGDGLGAAVGGKEPGGAVGGRAVGVAAGRVGTSVTVAGPGVGVGTRPVAVAAPEVAVAPISGVGPARCAVGVGGTGVGVRPGPIAQLASSSVAAATNRPVRSPADQREPRRPPGSGFRPCAHHHYLRSLRDTATQTLRREADLHPTAHRRHAVKACPKRSRMCQGQELPSPA
jgi:hypothetical protein